MIPNPFLTDEALAQAQAAGRTAAGGRDRECGHDTQPPSLPGGEAQNGASTETSERAAVNAAQVAVGEVVRATNKFPTWPTDPIHALAVVQEEVGELAKEVLQLTYEPHKSSLAAVRREAVQTAAMALRFLMSLGRYQFERGAQHSQTVAAESAPATKPSAQGDSPAGSAKSSDLRQPGVELERRANRRFAATHGSANVSGAPQQSGAGGERAEETTL